MKYIIFPILAIAGLFFLLTPPSNEAIAETTTPIVVELFTSQSCSSCPPADRVLAEITANNKNVIGLSCNVTYWNHLHWRDTLSQEFCTKRQRAYVQALNSRGPYTPQAVVNGTAELVGSRRGALLRTIAKTQPIAPINLTLTDKLSISLPNIKKGNYTLSLIIYGNDHIESIPSGENRGRTVTYTNPVQKILPLGQWDGTATTLTHDIGDDKSIKGYAVLAQKNGASGVIAAAGKIEK